MAGEAAAATAAHDDLDDLYNYDVNNDEAFADIQPNLNNGYAPPKELTAANRGVDLGIEGPIQVAKQRAPVAKLDETRLLSQAGIPKLRQITKKRLKFKGKGHEFSDVARLLNLYQLWLDDLFPKAKFADGITMIEKLGHSKRMQVMRREWINEGKPQDRDGDPKDDESTHQEPQSAPASLPTKVTQSHQDESASSPIDVEEASWVGSKSKSNETISSKVQTQDKDSLFISDDEDEDMQPPEDELDALLAESNSHNGQPNISGGKQLDPRPRLSPPSGQVLDEFADEMEAMEGMDDMW